MEKKEGRETPGMVVVVLLLLAVVVDAGVGGGNRDGDDDAVERGRERSLCVGEGREI